MRRQAVTKRGAASHPARAHHGRPGRREETPVARRSMKQGQATLQQKVTERVPLVAAVKATFTSMAVRFSCSKSPHALLRRRRSEGSRRREVDVVASIPRTVAGKAECPKWAPPNRTSRALVAATCRSGPWNESPLEVRVSRRPTNVLRRATRGRQDMGGKAPCSTTRGPSAAP